MVQSIRDWIWEAWFYVECAALIGVVVLIPLWTVFAIPYGMIVNNDNFVIGGGLGLALGVPIMVGALHLLLVSPMPEEL